MVFQSSIEKFRGFNKLVLSEIDYTILLIILVTLAFYFLVKAFYSKKDLLSHTQNKIFVTTITSFLLGIYFLISYSIFKEVGVATTMIPLTCGIVIGMVNLFVNKRSVVIDINEIVLLIFIPYQVTGVLGVALAFLCAFIYTTVIGSALNKEDIGLRYTISKLIPVLFIFASSEINENKGLITRFNLISGYQTAWIFISVIIVQYATKYFDKIKDLLKENEIPNALPFTISLFTIASLAVIIKLGGKEALSSLLLAISFYLFFVGFVKSKSDNEKLAPISVLSGLVGSISFWVLTKI